MRPLIHLLLITSALAEYPVIIPAKPPANGRPVITRSSDGKSYVTIPWGKGTLTRMPNGKTSTTIPWGNGTLTRTPDGKTYTTTGGQPTTTPKRK